MNTVLLLEGPGFDSRWVLYNPSPWNLEHLSEMMELMRTQHMKHVISKGINAYVGQKTGTLLFGEDNTNCKNEKRHKFLHERHGHA